MIQTQFKQTIQIVRSDNGGEYLNSQMKLFFQTKGIIHQTTCPHTPEQNGVAERKNRILLEMTRAFIIESHVPKMFWPEALATSTYLLNRLPTKILKLKTPLETLEEYTKIPLIPTLQPKVFGCNVFVHIPKSYHDKLDPCAEKCVFVGYGVNQKGYSTVHSTTQSEDHNSATEDISPNLISEVCNSQPNEPRDEFAETVNTATESEPTNEDVQEQGESIVEPAKYVLPAKANREIPAKRYSPERISKGSKYPMENIAVENLSKEAKVFTVSLYSEKVPSNVE
nr:putative ribonuclease H-like domain-containing protein [Tanacetum cinerariifolium]